jgi:hypothetical protein
MGWKQCKRPFYPDDLKIREAFEALFSARSAPKGMALFSRTTADLGSKIFLLTPDAANHSDALPGEWSDAGDPHEHGWSLLVGAVDTFKLFGLRPARYQPYRNHVDGAYP